MNTTETKINVRIDKKTKDQAQKTFKALGLDISSGIKLFLKSVVNTQSIPFEIRTQNGYTAQQEKNILESVKQAHKEIKSGKARMYNSASEMLADADTWKD